MMNASHKKSVCLKSEILNLKSEIAPPRPASRAAGFTLIELLVVIGIILALTSIAVPLALQLTERDQVGRGAGILQGALNQAKYIAQRTGRATGLRLLPSQNNMSLVEQAEFIQDPGDFKDGWVWAVVPPPGAAAGGSHNNPQPIDANKTAWDVITVITENATRIYSPAGAQTTSGLFTFAGSVVNGDFLEINGLGQVYLISGIPASGIPLTATFGTFTFEYLDLDRSLPRDIPVPTGKQSNYRITRQPRTLSGQPTVSMPRNVAIDISPFSSWNYGSSGYFTAGVSSYVSNAATGNIDILFAPSGQVVGSNASLTNIYLWLKDTSGRHQDSQMLVGVGTRSGQVGAYPVNVNPAYPVGGTGTNAADPNPYYFVEKSIGGQ